jgi:hypothetical protein
MNQKYLTIVSIYAHNIGGPDLIKQTLLDLKGQNTTFNTTFSPVDKSSRQKQNQQTNSIRPNGLNGHL